MAAAHLELRFPNLRDSFYSVESAPSVHYNCVAWAVGVTDDWWWPEDGSYWPMEPKEVSVQAFVLVFQSLGFKPCDDSSLEPGFEKLAIFTDSAGTPTHVARQLPTGLWTSKCGKLEDIIHLLEGLEGSEPAYGTVAQLMRRPLGKGDAD